MVWRTSPLRRAWVAVVAAAGEEEVEEQEHAPQELLVVAEFAVPLRLPDALGVALSGKATREEEEHDITTTQSRRLRCFRW